MSTSWAAFGLLLAPLAARAEALPPAFVGEAVPAFTGHFRASWNLTDGAGVLDHIAVEGAWGLQLGAPAPGGPPGVAWLGAVTGAIAEGGEPSLRIGGGVELPFAVHRAIECVPSFWVGGYRLWTGDQREGPMFRAAFGLRMRGEKGFSLTLSPLSLLVLPPPPDGWSRYTTHVALDVTVLEIGGRIP